MAVLLPLAAVGLVQAVPALQAAPAPWVAPGLAAAAAVIAGLALLVAVAAALEDGRLRDLADLAGLGMLTAALAVSAFGAGGRLGLGIGLVAAAAAFVIGTAARDRSLEARGWRVAGLAVALVLVEASLGLNLAAAEWSVSEVAAPLLLVAGAALLAGTGMASLDDPRRAMALGLAASSSLALAIGGAGNEGLIGTAGLGVAAAAQGWRYAIGRPQRAPELEPIPAHPELPGAEDVAPEYDELSRITRELRATLDDLVAARHLIELQRAEIERASSVDQLTGLPNRWTTLDRLRTEAAEARRYTHPVAAVLFDIDGFSAINHEHGLDVGDAILREMAVRLRVRMREADALGRIGADGFLAILPHTDEGGAATFANAVLDRLLERPVITARGEVALRLSIGIALMRAGMTLTGDELLAAAEEALDSARAAGGNRIAFDRLHGLARLDDRGRTPEAAGGEAADKAAER